MAANKGQNLPLDARPERCRDRSTLPAGRCRGHQAGYRPGGQGQRGYRGRDMSDLVKALAALGSPRDHA